MKPAAPSLPDSVSAASTPSPAAAATARYARGLLALAALGIPISLLWDFSWESTIGVDLVWAPPHLASYAVMALAGGAVLALVASTSSCPVARLGAVRLGHCYAPFGGWMAAWGALAFPAAVLFDRWWQSTYGLAAGIWHPPQILKAAAFLAVVGGAALVALSRQNQARTGQTRGWAAVYAMTGGVVLALLTVMMMTSQYPNRQHTAPFYQLACATYPVVLVALATAGRGRWPATTAAAFYTLLICSLLWVLPLFPARPQAAPVYHSLDHLMPPPFPLLLILPGVVLDALFRQVPWPSGGVWAWGRGVVAGLAFFIVFLSVQWLFAEFLLTDLADNRFFVGGGRHWPFFLKIDPLARVAFWESPADELTWTRAALAGAMAVGAALAGLGWGGWMKRVQR